MTDDDEKVLIRVIPTLSASHVKRLDRQILFDGSRKDDHIDLLSKQSGIFLNTVQCPVKHDARNNGRMAFAFGDNEIETARLSFHIGNQSPAKDSNRSTGVRVNVGDQSEFVLCHSP